MVSRLVSIAQRRGLTPEVALAKIAKSVPAFGEHLAQALGWQLPEI